MDERLRCGLATYMTSFSDKASMIFGASASTNSETISNPFRGSGDNRLSRPSFLHWGDDAQPRACARFGLGSSGR